MLLTSYSAQDNLHNKQSSAQSINSAEVEKPCCGIYCINLGTVVTPLISAIWEAEIKRTMVPGHPGQKVWQIPSQWKKKKNWVWWHVSVIPATAENLK
jgi:hypothetical protein